MKLVFLAQFQEKKNSVSEIFKHHCSDPDPQVFDKSDFSVAETSSRPSLSR